MKTNPSKPPTPENTHTLLMTIYIFKIHFTMPHVQNRWYLLHFEKVEMVVLKAYYSKLAISLSAVHFMILQFSSDVKAVYPVDLFY